MRYVSHRRRTGRWTLDTDRPATPEVFNLDIAGQGSDAEIQVGTDADVSIDVENVGDVSGNFDVFLEIIDSSNNTDYSETETTPELTSNETTNTVFSNVTGNLSEDTYSVIVSSGDASTPWLTGDNSPQTSNNIRATDQLVGVEKLTSDALLTGTGGVNSSGTFELFPSITSLGGTDDLNGDEAREAVGVVNGELQMRTETTTTTLTSNVDTHNMRMQTGSWNGNTSVFYPWDGSMYRVAPDTSPTEIKSMPNGISAVGGIGDIDGDGEDEIVYADGSQEVRYINTDKTTGTTGVTIGQNQNTGVGPVVSGECLVVDGSNQLAWLDSTGISTTFSVSAKKSPPTYRDGDPIYIDTSTGNLTKTNGDEIRDADGNPVSGDDRTGIVF